LPICNHNFVPSMCGYAKLLACVVYFYDVLMHWLTPMKNHVLLLKLCFVLYQKNVVPDVVPEECSQSAHPPTL
jgi:hypothetical protein